MVIFHKNSMSYLEELMNTVFTVAEKTVYHSKKIRKENKSKWNKYLETWSSNNLFTVKIVLMNFTGYFYIAIFPCIFCSGIIQYMQLIF